MLTAAASLSRPSGRLAASSEASRWGSKFPALSEDHALKCGTRHALLIAHKGNFSVLKAAWMLVCNNFPITATVLGHRNNEWVCTVDPLVWLNWVMVRSHEVSYELLHRGRLVDK